MDGQYLNKKEQYRKFLSDWINNAIRSKSWEKHQDLHLNEIDSQFREKANWIKGSLFIYEIILSLIKPDLYNCLLVIPLSYSDKETDINQLTWDKIRKLFDLTPPSFYLFPNGEENYEETIKELIFIERLSNDCSHKVFFKQDEEFEEEYSRSIYIINHPAGPSRNKFSG
ncbi:hypothetical protein J2X31_003293 [Flavobacterium arsenatis]|uniref:DUF924 domain-containing protein n=1 Tax=Flavobacterium arsenatis TaxID=1484332 RepID=A0ABU1TTT2_9FLAO|nr:hypothetical protein [Flavobacterium arsenatis]MDR6969266.1 hypothetical protein [Flavobacterium arsenatis]